MTKDLNSTILEDSFEACLVHMEAGKSLDEALAAYPEQAEALRPLLDTAAKSRALAGEGVPIAALQRSRTRMLARAEMLRREQRPGFARIPWRRLAVQLTVLIAVIGFSLTSLVFASAQTLPGDRLYGIKRAAEAARLTTADPQLRTSLQNLYRARRIEEIQELIRLRRVALVSFEGVLTEQREDGWEVGPLYINITPETRIVGEILPGMFVEVEGQTLENGEINAAAIYLRAYAFLGTLQARTGEIWLVDGVPVIVTRESQIAPGIDLGDQVVVLASVSNEGSISARAILASDQAPDASVTPGTLPGGTPPETASPAAVSPTPGTATPSPTVDPVPDPEGDDDTPEPDETEDPEKTEEPDETEEPEEEETEKPDNSGSGSSNSGSGSGSSGSGSGEPTESPDDD